MLGLISNLTKKAMNFARWIFLIVVINIAFIFGFYVSAAFFVAADSGSIIILYSAIIAVLQILFTVFRITEPLDTPSQKSSSINYWLPRVMIIFFVFAFGLFIYLKFQFAQIDNRYLIIIGGFAISLVSNFQLWHISEKKTSRSF
jgi:FlaA1/EpsC-like NDP-sugar epimerase